MSRRLLLLTLAFLLVAAGIAFLLKNKGDTTSGVRTIVLITPDTLRRDHVSAYAPPDSLPPHPHTPHMDRLAATGLRFDNARTPVPLTLPAHVTMLSGLPPAATGVRLNTYGRLPPAEERGFALLQEALQAHGWHTAAFLSAAVLGRRYGLDQGFDTYDDVRAEGGSRLVVKERAGLETVTAALAHARDVPADKPLFLWVHLFEPHAPYAADGSYAGEVLDLDTAIGVLLDGLRKLGRPDAAILLASDHGEALGELSEKTHGLLLADGVLRVPFLLSAPGVAAGTRAAPVTIADVAPTLAALAGVPWSQLDGPGSGLDVLGGRLPTERIQVAESLYAHHRFRWAQLVSASAPAGTLVDAGLERLHWLPRSGFQRFLSGSELVQDNDCSRRLADMIAKYKQIERPDRIRAGQVAGGYGGGGQVVGFLPPQENARLPDPQLSIARASQVDQIKANITFVRQQIALGKRPARRLEAALDALRALDKPHLDAGSPELHFWIGEGWKLKAVLDAGAGGDPAESLSHARDHYLKAFALGRKDTQTLVQACVVQSANAAEALESLRTLGKQVENPGCQYYMLMIKLLREVNRGAEADEICKSAESKCGSPKDRALYDRTCR